jgi:hypothetical protein
MKDSVEIRLPGGDFFFVVLGVDMSRNHVSFTLLDDPPLDLCHSPEARSKFRQRVAQSACYRRNSRRQLVDCFAHRVAEVAQPLPLQSPVEGGTDVRAGQPKFDVVHPVDHGVLCGFRSVFGQQKNQKGTHSDHCEDNADGAKNGLGRCNTREFLGEIQSFDGGIQRRDCTLPSFRSLGLGLHGRDLR